MNPWKSEPIIIILGLLAVLAGVAPQLADLLSALGVSKTVTGAVVGVVVALAAVLARSQVTPVAKLEAATPLAARDRDLTPPPTVKP